MDMVVYSFESVGNFGSRSYGAAIAELLMATTITRCPDTERSPS
jgi:hypothetical protein